MLLNGAPFCAAVSAVSIDAFVDLFHHKDFQTELFHFFPISFSDDTFII